MENVGATVEAAKALTELVRIGGATAAVDLLKTSGAALLGVRDILAMIPNPLRCPGTCPRSPWGF